MFEGLVLIMHKCVYCCHHSYKIIGNVNSDRQKWNVIILNMKISLPTYLNVYSWRSMARWMQIDWNPTLIPPDFSFSSISIASTSHLFKILLVHLQYCWLKVAEITAWKVSDDGLRRVISWKNHVSIPVPHSAYTSTCTFVPVK